MRSAWVLAASAGCAGWVSARPDRDEPAALPEVVVTADNTRLEKPCRVVIPPGTVIADADGNGVIHVAFEWGVVEFAPGSVLRGAAEGAAPDTMSGTGIRIEGREGVTIRGARVSGYKVGLHATQADGLVLDGCRFEDLWRHRLKSTPKAEDAGDWLWPHENDGSEWRRNYGAAACVERSSGVTVRGCIARQGQNGVILDRVERSEVYDNDLSFLSGWGLALWRASHNLVSRNALDFCVRGYSHGVYNRGQDSAGILCFEQCVGNTFIENSATHGGDGFFGFAGKEALGEKPAPQPDWPYLGRGNSRNVFVGNDFSYAAAHGLELTFSVGNVIERNRFVENAICGIWGGYSSSTTIVGNTFQRNGPAGYGLERGGINIEHGSHNLIASNTFEGNACGIHLWWDEDAGIAKLSWAKANGVESADNWLQDNTFKGDATAVHLRATKRTTIRGQSYEGCAKEVLAEGGSDVADSPKARPIGEARATAKGETKPVGARASLAGRQNIIMTEWGPWDHASPLFRLDDADAWIHQYDAFNLSDGELTIAVESGAPAVEARVRAVPDGDPRSLMLFAVAESPGLHEYAIRVRVGAVDQRLSGVLWNCSWDVAFFPSPCDPREDLAAWRAGARSDKSVKVELATLRLPFGMKGPSDLVSREITQDLRDAKLPRDRFGTVARTVVPLAPGTYRVTTLSDDGVRVRWRTGGVGRDESPWRTAIENWTHHGPTRDTGEIVVEGGGAGGEGGGGVPAGVEIEVEHFELDGYAVLEVGLARVVGK